MGDDHKIIIKRDMQGCLSLLVSLLTSTVLTERETEILGILITLTAEEITPEVRKILKGTLGISRENLTNMLIRMQDKGVFGKDWRMNEPFRPLLEPLHEIVIELG